jgi:hypothetical protein
MTNVSLGKRAAQCLAGLAAAAALAASVSGQTAGAPTSPCRSAAEYRAFDFWIGDWEVESAAGKPAGVSRIELLLDQCVVFENWTGKNGYEGKSFNLYHPATRKWEQIWVDNMGEMVRFEGEARDGNLYYRAEVTEDGRPALRRMTFFAQGPDRVRQLGERSVDGGKTWRVDYDLIYKRKK